MTGKTTFTGDYFTQDLAGDKELHTFTAQATFSMEFENAANPGGEVFVNFSGVVTPEPTSLILVIIGACFMFLCRNAWLAQGVKRQA